MLLSVQAKHVSASRGLITSKAPLAHRRLLWRTTGVLSLSAAPAETSTHRDASEVGCDSRPGQHTPPSPPKHSHDSTLPAMTAAEGTPAMAAALNQAQFKDGSSKPQHLMPLVGAAVVLGVACAGEARIPVGAGDSTARHSTLQHHRIYFTQNLHAKHAQACKHSGQQQLPLTGPLGSPPASRMCCLQSCRCLASWHACSC